MLKLRRGTVVAVDPLTVEVGGEHRPAWADTTMVGEVEVGDEVVVNTQARDLGLGSGGFDIVHVNLSRGLYGGGERADPRDQAQLHVAPAPRRAGRDRARRARPRAQAARPWSSRCTATWRRSPGRRREARPGLRVGFLQGAGRGAAGVDVARRARAARPRPALRPRHRRARLRRRARGDQPRRRPRRGRAPARAGRRSSSAPGPGSSARRPGSATAGWRRSTRRTRRSPSACRRCSARGCRARTSASATAGSATTRRRCSSCCSPPCGCRSPRPSSRAGRCSARRTRPPVAPRRRRSTS